MPISIWSGSAILHSLTGWEFRLWNNFGMALIQTPNFSYTMQTYKSSETSNAKLFTIFQTNISLFQTLFRSGKLLCKFQDFFKNLRLCTDPVWGFFFTWGFAFALKYFISLWVFVFALRFVVLPWGFWFCHEVFAFAVKRGISYCCDSCGPL